MISHCANSDCTQPFHYLRGGRLYRFDIKSPSTPCSDVPNSICSLKPSRATVFFWLCDECSSKHSLRFNLRDGIRLVSLTEPAKRSTAPVIAGEDATPDREVEWDARKLRENSVFQLHSNQAQGDSSNGNGY